MIWTPPRRELVDPAKEIRALIEGVKAGFMSLSEVQRSLGFIPEEVIEELGDDMARARENGLSLSTDGGTGGQAAGELEEDRDREETEPV
jgi:capsid protein